MASRRLTAVLTLLMVSGASRTGSAQWSDEVQHGIGVRLGARGTTVREDLLVPLTFSGGGLGLGSSYLGVVGPGLLAVRIDVGLSIVANRFGHLGMTLDHQLGTAYLLPVDAEGPWRLDLGAALAESSDSLALESWDDAHGYWLGLAYLGPAGRVTGPLAGGWQLELTTELALLGTAGRPPEYRRNKQDPTTHFTFYAFHTHDDPRLFAIWDAQLLRFDLALRPTTRRSRVGDGGSFGWQGRFTHVSFPQTMLVLEVVLYGAWTWSV